AWATLKENKWKGVWPTASRARSLLEYAALYLFASERQLSAGEGVVNLQNGLFDLNTGALSEHRYDLYLTSQLPFAFNPGAGCPTWLAFLRDVLRTGDGRPDLDLIDLLQEAFGYSLTADTDQRASFWLVGASGSGKSTVLNVLIALAGDSHVTIDLDAMHRDSYQLADIVGKRVVTFTEPSSGGVLADGHYKRLVSQDTINARNPYGKWFRFVPQCKVWGAMNQTPRVVDRSDAVFNRVVIVPMNYVVPSDQRDGRLIDKLRAELPGIFNWAVAGLFRLRERGGFQLPDQVAQAREAYRSENDTEAAFVEDWCYTDPDVSIKASDLYSAYRYWCERNGVRSKSSRKVAHDWQRLGFERRRSNGTVYVGLALKSEAERD
ncbi:MAG: phage/plasmid primase, P4 family, partial [Chloroflexota bacterium]